MYQAWICFPKPFLRYWEKELFSCVKLGSKVTDHYHLHRYVLSLKLFAQTVLEILQERAIFMCLMTHVTLNDLWPWPVRSTSTQIWAWYQERPKEYLNQIWTCLVNLEPRYRPMKKWIPNCWQTDRRTDKTLGRTCGAAKNKLQNLSKNLTSINLTCQKFGGRC